MVYHYQYAHVYRCPFQKFLQTDLNRHFEINESHKTSVRVIEKTRDPVDGSQRILLQTSWKNIIPEPLQQIDNLNVDEILFEEEFWIDENQQGYWHRCRNVTLDNLLQIWQASTYSKDNDSNWTYSEEEGGVEVFTKDRLGAILENVIGKFINNCIKSNIAKTDHILECQSDIN